MPGGDKVARRAAKRLREGTIPDPLGLGKPSIAVPGERRPWAVGERRIMGNGYVYVKTDEGEKTEARLVMERELGRELRRGESARHRNGDRLDARPENLVLYRNNVPVDLADAMNGKPPRVRKPRRSTVYAILPIPEDCELVRAHNVKEAAEKAETEGIVVLASRIA